MIDLTELREQVGRAGEAAMGKLLAERQAAGWWEGELSSSALSTAVAVLALGALELGEIEQKGTEDTKDMEDGGGGRERGLGRFEHRELIAGGLRWLAATQLADGGWGDTVKSRANVATTLLVWAALGMGERLFGSGGELGDLGTQQERRTPGGGNSAGASSTGLGTQRELRPPDGAGVVARAEGWIRGAAGGLEPGHLKAALAKRYGKDKTFAVPILMACAVGGRLGPGRAGWREVPALPFELAAFPRQWFAALRLPVVSYALPALIAIGQVRHFQAPVRGPWAWVRQAAVGRTRRLLREIQPDGGGFLEATPLTGFVTMALCSAGAAADPVVREAVGFLRCSVREDGSWPIDTNLATWGTTLSVKALGMDFPKKSWDAVRGWLLGQQYQEQHAYCLSAPGGWAWTDLPGGVPDADDTAGALLALRELSEAESKVAELKAAEAGVRWLAGLQNGDGGMPTFCKGWGALPFDRSAPDLTAHALAAWQAWRGEVSADLGSAMRRAVAWLGKTQRADGAWLPLWFGNEHEADEGNPVYGTAVVLKYLCRLPSAEFPGLAEVGRKAAVFLAAVQQEDGAWSGGAAGGPGSIEETAAALEALVAFGELAEDGPGRPGGESDLSIRRGAEALLRLTGQGTAFPPAPIGLYFARLWYYEKLYPQIAAVAAFRALRSWLTRRAG